MFPDPSVRWQPFPSVLDGIRYPFALDRGLQNGVLHLSVFEALPGLRAYGVKIACEAYFACEEMIYSVADHGNGTSMYDGIVYIREAQESAFLAAYARADPLNRKPRHFLFVGGDFCYECLSFKVPTIVSLSTHDEACRWGPEQDD